MKGRGLRETTEETAKHPAVLCVAWLKHFPGRVPVALPPDLTSLADPQSSGDRIVLVSLAGM